MSFWPYNFKWQLNNRVERVNSDTDNLRSTMGGWGGGLGDGGSCLSATYHFDLPDVIRHSRMIKKVLLPQARWFGPRS